MDINTFLKAYTLFRNKTGNEDIKDTGVIVSNINGIIQLQNQIGCQCVNGEH